MSTVSLEVISGIDSAQTIVVPSFDRQSAEEPRILLATTGLLASTARIAMELHAAGARVSLLAPTRHPGRVLDLWADGLIYRAAAPCQSLEAAMRRIRPHMVIPCDERAVRDLHRLHRATRHQELRPLIERSLGPAETFPTVTSRAALLELARQQGVRVPPFASLPSAAALDDWLARNPAPFVLKADGSWSGFGVRIIPDAAQARTAFEQMTRRAGFRLAVREMLLEGNNFAARSWLSGERPTMSAQGYIDGWPANIGVACWQGEVLAASCVEAVSTVSATGPSTVSRIISHPEMAEAAGRIVKALGLSGMIGFDFMIEAATGAAYLIEMNPRVTPICAVPLGAGRDLTEALVARLATRAQRERPARTNREILAFFPDTWELDPANHFLRDGYHDVPWEQPALVRMLMRPALRDRYPAMRLLRKAWWAVQGQKPPLR